MLKNIVLGLLVLVTSPPTSAWAQSDQVLAERAATWRQFAERLEAGAPLTLRLRGGQRVKGSFLEARSAELVVLPKTRVPVPAQAVRYEEVISIERDVRGGVNVGKAIVIGAASGAAAFASLLLILFAAGFD